MSEERVPVTPQQVLSARGKPMTKRAKILISVGGGLVLATMLVTALKIGLGSEGTSRVLVVTMTQDAVESDRVALKAECGGLPGIAVVKDTGNPNPEIQGKFPVRFDLRHASSAQYIALTVCINDHGSKVRGFLTEEFDQ